MYSLFSQAFEVGFCLGKSKRCFPLVNKNGNLQPHDIKKEIKVKQPARWYQNLKQSLTTAQLNKGRTQNNHKIESNS